MLLLLAGATLAALLPSAAEQGPTATATSNRAKPTIVLVHGAWADSSSWSEVVRRLQARDDMVDVPPNPLRGLASDSAYLASFNTHHTAARSSWSGTPTAEP